MVLVKKINKKDRIYLTLDPEVKLWANANIKNISAEINQYLRQKMAIYATPEMVQEQQLIKEIREHKEKANKEAQALAFKQIRLKELRRVKEEEEAKRLELKKEQYEASIKCLNCKNLIEGHKGHKLKKGRLCNACFMTLPPEIKLKWI